MNQVRDAAFANFFRRWHPTMVRIGVTYGAGHWDAEDAASTVAIRIWRKWPHWLSVENKNAYLHTAMKNEIAKTRQKGAGGVAVEIESADDSRLFTPHQTVAETYDRICEFEGIREFLTILPRRQREILAWLYLGELTGWKIADIGSELEIDPATIRSQRRYVRPKSEPFFTGEGHEHRRWLRAGERIHEEFHRGRPSLLSARPIIRRAWNLLKENGITPERGTRVVLVSADELRRRRRQSPLAVMAPTITQLTELAKSNNLMAVVLDTHDIVLHRSGHPAALAAADRLGFIDGSAWTLSNAGVNAAGLAGALGCPVTVNRFEHSFPDQHSLSCVAIPLRLADSRHITVNLTTSVDSMANVPPVICRQLHTMTQRLQRQLWARM